MVPVPEGFDQGFDGAGIPGPAECIRGAVSHGRVHILQGGDQGFDGRGADSRQGVRGPVPDGCILVPQGVDQRPDGRGADADQGIGGILADAEVLIPQGGKKGFNGAGTPDLAEGARCRASDREIVIPKCGDQGVNGAGILHRPEGGGCVPPDGSVFSGHFLNETVCGIDIFPLGKTGTEGEQDCQGQRPPPEKAARHPVWAISHDALHVSTGETSTASHSDRMRRCDAIFAQHDAARPISVAWRECRTDGEPLSTP